MANVLVARRQTFVLGTGASVVLLALANQNWLVTPAGWLDPFIYINYFREFGDVNGEGVWTGNYKASRVPWNVIGNVVSATVGLYRAQFVLAFLSIAVLGFVGFHVGKKFDLQIGFLTTAIFVFFPTFHGNGGWLYQNSISGPVQAIFVWVSFLILSSDEPPSRSRGFSIILGLAAVALAIVNTMQALVLLPAFLFVTIHFIRKRHRRDLSQLFAYSVLGGVLALSVTAGLSALFGGPVRFYEPLYRTFDSYSSGYHEVWWVPLGSGWWRDAGYLAAPIVIAVVGISQWLRSRIDKNSLTTLEAYAIWSHLGAIVVWIGSYQFLKFHLLNYEYHAYPIIITSVFALAASQSVWKRRRESNLDVAVPDRRVHLLWLGPFVCLVLPFASFTISLGQSSRLLQGSFIEKVLIYFLIVGLWRSTKRRSSFVVLQVVTLCLPLLALPRSDYSASSVCDARLAGNEIVFDLAARFNDHPKPIFVISVPQDTLDLGTSCSVELDNVVASLSEVHPFWLPPLVDFPAYGQGTGSSDFGHLLPVSRTGEPYEFILITGRRDHQSELNNLLKKLGVSIPDFDVKVLSIDPPLRADLKISYAVIRPCSDGDSVSPRVC